MEVHKDGVGGVDGLDGANSVTMSPDGKHVYTTAQFDDAVAVFSVASPSTSPVPVPGVAPWGLIAVALALAAAAYVSARRRPVLKTS